jgi:hypothetical protein
MSAVSLYLRHSFHFYTIILSEEERKRDMEVYHALKAQKRALEQALTAKLNVLKDVCVKEGVS